MNKITLLFIFSLVHILQAQQAEVKYDHKLNLVTGISMINGAEIDPLTSYGNLRCSEMVFTDKSSLTFVNCVVKVNGTVDATANCQMRLINSYIICRNYRGPYSKRIITTNNIKNCKVSQIKYVKKLKGNPKIEIINKAGKVVAKGYKEDISNELIETGVYDVRSKGNFYESNVLLAGN